MKIEIRNTSSPAVGTPNPFIICSGGIQSPLEDWSGAYPFEKEFANPIDALSAVPFDRQNRKTDWTFTIVYDRPTIASAEAFIMSLGSIPTVGLITFTTEGGVSALVRTLNPGLLTVVGFKDIGTAVVVTWNIMGGQLT